jgi:SAM-dependent methyltransferase
MTPLAHQLSHCILCRSTDLEEVLSLRGIPIPTPNYVVPAELRSLPDIYSAVPLNLNLCSDCGHLQLSHVPDVEVAYRNYSYKTALSVGLREHFRGYAADVMNRYSPRPDGFALEIGSNDGSLLAHFRSVGMQVLGIDPATAIAEDATASGVRTLPEFFSAALARQIRSEYGAANIVLANNVTANVEDMVDFAEGIREILAADGIAVFETQYGADVIERNLLDTVYHEHLSYYMVTPLARHCARHGLQVIDVQRIATKGGSIRVTMQLLEGPRQATPSVAEMLDEEARKGAFSARYYAALPRWIDEIRRDLGTIVHGERKMGRSIAGWGVSVGTCALLPQFDLNNEIDFLVDDDPNKEPILRGPDYAIPVVQPTEFYKRNPGAVIVFAWRYMAPILHQHQQYVDSGGKFVVPLPHVNIIKNA